MTDSSSPPAPLVSILTVGFQSQEFITACFGSIFAHHPQHDVEVLFIDNGDGATETVVRAQFPQVRIVPSQGNIGFGAGNNRLAAQARGRYLMLLNPDARFIDDGIAALVAFARAHPQASIWGGATLDREMNLDVADDLHFPRIGAMARGLLSSGRRREDRGEVDRTCRQVEVISGGFMMIDRAAWDDAGGFDESFFLYSEEVDLMYRLARKGHVFLATDSARIVHEVGGADNLSPRRQMYKTTGAMHFFRKHWPAPVALAGGVLLWAEAVKRSLGGRLLAKRSQRMAQLGTAFAPIASAPWKWWNGYRPRG